VFLVTHPTQDALSREQTAALIRWAGNQAKLFLKKPGVEIKLLPEDQILSLSTKALRFSQPDGRPPTGPNNRSKRPSAVKQPDSFTMLFPTVEGVTLEELVRLGHHLHDPPSDVPSINKILETATLDEVSLNWLNSGGSNGLDHGGPGGPPSTTIPPIPSFQFQLLDKGLGSLGNGEGVEVVILDSVPTQADRDKAYKTLGATGVNPLVRDLLVAAGILQVEPASAATAKRLETYVLTSHPFSIADHGLFIAGIIHSLAPVAKLHLIEVLNHFCIGDVQSLTYGLQRAVALMTAGNPARWVVNCSLMLNNPVDEEQLKGMIRDLEDQKIGRTPPDIADLIKLLRAALIGGNPGLLAWLLNNQAMGVEILCNVIYLLRSRVIAAAGNDRKPGVAAQPEPCYPAVSDSVLGVGAVAKRAKGKWLPANYSNTADRPTSAGITTFGGEAGSGNGVLGVYTGTIPGDPVNADGLAWWSGTSFATGVISGVVAAMMGGSPAPASTRDAIEQFATMGLTVSNQNEDILQAQQ